MLDYSSSTCGGPSPLFPPFSPISLPLLHTSVLFVSSPSFCLPLLCPRSVSPMAPCCRATATSSVSMEERKQRERKGRVKNWERNLGYNRNNGWGRKRERKGGKKKKKRGGGRERGCGGRKVWAKITTCFAQLLTRLCQAGDRTLWYVHTRNTHTHPQQPIHQTNMFRCVPADLQRNLSSD